MLVALFQIPCRSGSPQGVFGCEYGLVVFAAAVVFAAVAGVWPATGTDIRAAPASTPTALRNR